MQKIKVLFLIHDLGQGGAEKVLVNLVNNLNTERFEIHVISLFGGGVYEKELRSHIKYKSLCKKVFRGNRMIVKFLPPALLHSLCVKEQYDIEIAFLEGSISKIISGCKNSHTKTISWIHTDQRNYKGAISYFKNKKDADSCYNSFDCIVGVSESVKNRFMQNFPSAKQPVVLYNVFETDQIKKLSEEEVTDWSFSDEEINVVTVGKVIKSKGFERYARIFLRLRKEGIPVHFYIIGSKVDREETEKINRIILNSNEGEYFTFLGYKKNPYKYMKCCDLYVCPSFQEGFSTASTESLVVGVPVCTTNVAGMYEMLGANNEWGIVADNDEDSLYEAINRLITTPSLLQYYKGKAKERGVVFSKENTVNAVEKVLLDLYENRGEN